MELTQLRYVLQLASTSNFSKAADRLYIPARPLPADQRAGGGTWA